MENKHICQSCSMPIESVALAGTEADGSRTWEYCIYCYRNGAFTKPGITLDEMKAFIQAEMKIQNIPEKISLVSLNSLADLNRWKLLKTEK